MNCVPLLCIVVDHKIKPAVSVLHDTQCTPLAFWTFSSRTLGGALILGQESITYHKGANYHAIAPPALKVGLWLCSFCWGHYIIYVEFESLILDWLADQLTGWQTNWPAGRPTDWLAGYLTDSLTLSLVDWLTNWLTESGGSLRAGHRANWPAVDEI